MIRSSRLPSQKTTALSSVHWMRCIAASDYLSLHVGLTPQTQNMINAESLKKMKKGVRIVNCARGELIDEAALAAALQEGQVAAAALDVFAEGAVEGLAAAEVG